MRIIRARNQTRAAVPEISDREEPLSRALAIDSAPASATLRGHDRRIPLIRKIRFGAQTDDRDEVIAAGVKGDL